MKSIPSHWKKIPKIIIVLKKNVSILNFGALNTILKLYERKKELPSEQILNTPAIKIHSFSFRSEIARYISIGWSHGKSHEVWFESWN